MLKIDIALVQILNTQLKLLQLIIIVDTTAAPALYIVGH